MASTIKPLGPVTNLHNVVNSTFFANSLDGASQVWVYNSNLTVAQTVYRNDADGSQIASLLIPPATVLVIEKRQTDTLNASSNTIQAARIGATN